MPETYKYCLLTANQNQSYLAAFKALDAKIDVRRITKNAEVDGKTIPAGSFVIQKNKALNSIISQLKVAPIYSESKPDVETEKLVMPRIALVESYFHDMDAGWTRFVFDSYKIPYAVVRPGDFENTDFVKSYDMVIFPNEDKTVLMEGKYKRGNEYYPPRYAPEFTKGMGKKGFNKLMLFVENGGIVLSWGASATLFDGVLSVEKEKDEKEEFKLPFSDVSDNLQKNGLYIPGSLVRLQITQNHQLTYGMPEEIGVFYRGKPVFNTSIPSFDTDRRVIGLFPEKNILMSGYAENEEKVGNKAGMVWLRKGKGQLVVYTFNPQFRASTQGAYKLLFNGILLPEIKN